MAFQHVCQIWRKGEPLKADRPKLCHMEKQGTGAPTGVPADLLRKAGASRVNLTQRLPYESREGIHNSGVYEELRPFMEYFLEKVMDQVRNKIKHGPGSDFCHGSV